MTGELGESSTISIVAKFTTPQSEVDVEHRFDESNCEVARIGLPQGVEAVKPQGGDYKYSGMADHGPLPPPKEGGTFAQLISFARKAQKSSDELLTSIIEQEKSNSGKANGVSKHKRQKT